MRRAAARAGQAPSSMRERAATDESPGQGGCRPFPSGLPRRGPARPRRTRRARAIERAARAATARERHARQPGDRGPRPHPERGEQLDVSPADPRLPAGAARERRGGEHDSEHGRPARDRAREDVWRAGAPEAPREGPRDRRCRHGARAGRWGMTRRLRSCAAATRSAQVSAKRASVVSGFPNRSRHAPSPPRVPCADSQAPRAAGAGERLVTICPQVPKTWPLSCDETRASRGGQVRGRFASGDTLSIGGTDRGAAWARGPGAAAQRPHRGASRGRHRVHSRVSHLPAVVRGGNGRKLGGRAGPSRRARLREPARHLR